MNSSVSKNIKCVIAVLFLSLFISCNNFFNGQDFLEKLNDAMAYQSAPSYTVRVKAAEGSGTVFAGGGDNSMKVTDSLVIGFQLNPDYTFIEWRAVSKTDEVTPMDEYVTFENAGELETKITLIQGSDDILIYPVAPSIKTCKVITMSDFGRFTNISEGNYHTEEKQNLGFISDAEYQFIKWHVINDKGQEVTDCVVFDDEDKPNTMYKLKAIPADTAYLRIEPLCVKRPKVISATPDYDANGVYRDRTIVVMFDKPIEQSSIYFTSTEKTEIENQYGVGNVTWLDEYQKKNENNIITENLGSDYCYGYKVNDEIFYKNIKITRVENENENLLKYYMNPELDPLNPRFLTIHVNLNNMPEVGVNILVTLSKDIHMKQEGISEDVKIKEDFAFSYRTNHQTDNDPPQINTFNLKIGSTDLPDTTGTTSEIAKSSKIKTYNLFNDEYVENVRQRRDLTVTANLSDGNGSGLTSFQWKAEKVENPYYPLSTVGKYSCEGQITATSSVNTTVDFSGKEMTQGEYKITFTAMDLNGNKTTTAPKYFIWDCTPPNKSDFKYNVSYARDKIKVTFKKSSSSDYAEKTTYHTDDGSGEKIMGGLTADLTFGGNSRTHNITITDYDYAGNTSVSTIAISAIPSVGMIYYSDGYWALPDYYDSSRTPEGVILKLNSDTQFYIWDIWDQYGYCWGSTEIYLEEDMSTDVSGLTIYNKIIDKYGVDKLLAKGKSRKNTDEKKSPTIWSYVIEKNKEGFPDSVSSEQWFIPSRNEMDYVFINLNTLGTAFDKIQSIDEYTARKRINETDYAYKRVQLFDTTNDFCIYWTCMLHRNRKNGCPSAIIKQGIFNNADMTWLGFYEYQALGTKTYKEKTYFMAHSALDSEDGCDHSCFLMNYCIRYNTDDFIASAYDSGVMSGDMRTHAMALVTLKD